MESPATTANDAKSTKRSSQRIAATSTPPAKKGKKTNSTAADAAKKSPSAPEIKIEDCYDPAHKYRIYIMDNSKYQAYDDIKQADEFYDDMQSIIVDKRSFSSKKKFNDYKKFIEKKKSTGDGKVDATTPVASVNPNMTMSPQEMASVERCKKRRELMRPSNRIELVYKTTKRSKICVVVFRFRDVMGKDFWLCKPANLKDTLKAYVQDFPRDDSDIQHAMENIYLVKMRDPNGGPEAGVSKSIKRNDKTVTYEEYVGVTHIPIPVDKIESYEEEEAHIQDACRRIGENFKTILASDTFQAILQCAVSEKFWKQLTDPKSGPNFVQYMNESKVVVQQSLNLNSHVVLADVKAIMLSLVEESAPQNKYPEMVDDNDNDEEESDADDDDGNQLDQKNDENNNDGDGGEKTANT